MMSIDCEHWANCGICGGGCCAISLYGGRPSLGTCAVCVQRKPTAPGFVQKVAHGLVGIAKAVTGTGGASDELVKHRTAICSGCEHAELIAGILQNCKICGCSTWAKIRNADEKCPEGKW